MFIGTWFLGRSVSWSPKLAVAHPWKSHHLAWAEHHFPPEVIWASWNTCLYTQNGEGLVLRTRETRPDHSHCTRTGAIGASIWRKTCKGAASCTSACELHYLPREWHTWFYFSPQSEIIPACTTPFQDDVLTTSLLSIWTEKGKDRENSCSQMESKQGETGPVSYDQCELEGALLASACLKFFLPCLCCPLNNCRAYVSWPYCFLIRYLVVSCWLPLTILTYKWLLFLKML